MKESKWRRYLAIYGLVFGSFIFSFFLGGFLFGMVAHENSHALTCMVFGLRIRAYSLSQVVYEASPNPIVNTVVGLAGGAGQALTSFISCWYLTMLEKRVFGKPPYSNMVLGFELGFLTIAFHGVINAVWEGFFFEHYGQQHGNLILTLIIALFSLFTAAIVLGIRNLQKLARRGSEKPAPFEEGEAGHIKQHADGGHTTESNERWLCVVCNRLISQILTCI
jgi:hypothetical protein